MAEVSLSAGPPFAHQPGDAGGAARDLFRQATGVQSMTGEVRTAHAPVPATVTGDLIAPLDSAVTPALDRSQRLSDSSLLAAGALRIFDGAVQTYNRVVDDLNRRWSGLADTDGDADETTAADEASLRAQLRSEQQAAQGELDGAAAEAAGLLRAGPETMADPAVARTLLSALQSLRAPEPDYGFVPEYDLRVMTLNIGSGVKYFPPGNDEGFDPADVPGLAQRILDGEVDVANLQEVFAADARELENELERQSGDDWTLAFAGADNKWRGWSPIPETFGNAVLVRAPEDGSAGSNGISLVDSTTQDLLSGSSEGRSMAAVTVESASGQRVTIGTSHTDYTGLSEEDQAEQLQVFRQFTEDFAAETGGDHTVLTGDLNHEVGENEPAGQELRSWRDDYANAGGSVEHTHDHGHGKTIDYIWTSDGLDYDNVDRVPGDHPDVPGIDPNMSDHDGIALDLDLSYSDTADDNDPPPEPERPGPLEPYDPEPNDPGPDPDREPSPSPGPPPTPDD